MNQLAILEEIIPPEEVDLLKLAEEVNDAEYLANHRLIRQRLIMEYANPMNDKIDLKDFCARNRVKHEVVVMLSRTHNFQADLTDFIERFWMQHGGYGEVLAEAIRQLNKKVGKGDIRAIELVLKLRKIMGRGDERTKEDTTFEEELAKMKRANGKEE